MGGAFTFTCGKTCLNLHLDLIQFPHSSNVYFNTNVSLSVQEIQVLMIKQLWENVFWIVLKKICNITKITFVNYSFCKIISQFIYVKNIQNDNDWMKTHFKQMNNIHREWRLKLTSIYIIKQELTVIKMRSNSKCNNLYRKMCKR